jgi:hypothetical protein
VGEAVDLAINCLEGLQVQGQTALSALEAPFVEVLVSSLDILEGIDSLGANITLGVGHVVNHKQVTKRGWQGKVRFVGMKKTGTFNMFSSGGRDNCGFLLTPTSHNPLGCLSR